MDWTANVGVHESASPSFLREQIVSELEQGRVHPHLLYSGLRQSSLWIELHQALSPARRDQDCVALYDAAFQKATEGLRGNVAHVVSLACGDGSKDVRCLKQIRASERAAIYTPVDLSLDLVLTACRESSAAIRGLQATPLLCDLPRCSVLPAILKSFDPSGSERILLFLGTIHNYWPPEILRSILYPLRSLDQLLLSANLAPAEAYDEALQRILPQYENEPTRRWLMGGLSELGLGEKDGEIRFQIQRSAVEGLKRIEAIFVLHRKTRVRVLDRDVVLPAEQPLSVFFSHRFTVNHMTQFLVNAGLTIAERWIDKSESEGLFLCRRAGNQ